MANTVFNNNGCWVFVGHCNNYGYGQIEYQERPQLVHRISFRLMKGKIGKGLYVLHKCDNPPCWNPDHLFKGTQLDNIRDMINKGRAGVPGPTKLPEAQPLVMKRRFL